MRRTLALISAACALACPIATHATALSCAERLERVGVHANSLPINKTFELDGQTVTVDPNDTGESICKRVDAANAPLVKLQAENERLREENQRIAHDRDYFRMKATDTNWFRRNYIPGWLGWPALWSFFLFLMGRASKGNSASSGSLFSFFR
jgi:hypothetical protein